MIDVKELMYDIDLKLNKVGTNEHQDISVEDKLIALNDAQINLIKTKFSENNVYKAGLDSFQKRYNDLEMLIENDRTITPKKIDNSPLNKWEADLTKLKSEYMLSVPGSEYILADKNGCTKSVINVNIIRHGDITTYLSNTNTSPSFEYQETIGTYSNHKYEVYTDGTFTPTEFHLSYVRYPKKLDFPGYTHFDGKASVTVNSELPYYLKEEIVDIAVRNLAISTENSSAVQGSTLRIQNDE